MESELMKENLVQALAHLLKVADAVKESEKSNKTSNDILYLERSFGRRLTSEEKNLVLEKGKDALFDKLGLDQDDFNTMLRAFALISAGFTESSDRYDYELEQNNYKVLDLFKSLINDLECVEAEKHKIKIGKKDDLGTKVTIKDSCDAGYSEEKDLELDELFKDAEKAENPNKTFIAEDTYKADPDLNKVFASETRCDEMHITGDTYEEDDNSWKNQELSKEEKGCNKRSFEDEVKKSIERLDKGCELELDEETIDAIVEKLWKERNNVSIKICNNKISLQ